MKEIVITCVPIIYETAQYNASYTSESKTEQTNQSNQYISYNSFCWKPD